MIVCCNGCRTDILILFQNLDSNILRSYVSRQEGALLGLLVSSIGFSISMMLQQPFAAEVFRLIVFKLTTIVGASLRQLCGVRKKNSSLYV